MVSGNTRRDPNAGKTVSEILKEKQGQIRSAALPRGFPGWDAVGEMTWEEVNRRAEQNEPGFRLLKKLLGDRRFNR